MKGDASLFAAVDLGSNAFRMMIGQRVLRDKRLVIEKIKTLREPVRRAVGLQDNALDPRALERGWQALERFCKRLRGFEDARVRAVATRTFYDGRVDSRFLQMAEQAACVQLARAARPVRQHGWHIAVGTSGAARMLAKALRANELNDCGRDGITYTGLLRLSLKLLEAGQLKRLTLDGLQPHRLGTLPGGLAVILAAFKVFGIKEMSPSEPGLRFGLLHGLIHGGARHC